MVLESEGPRVAGSRVRYPSPLRDYAELFEHDERSIKRWIALGKKAVPVDLPPLHRPEEMPAWWRRRMSQDVPQCVLSAATVQKVHPAPVPPAAAIPEPSQSPTPSEPTPPRDFSAVQGDDLATNVAKLRISVAIAGQLRDEAQRGPDEALIASRSRAYRDAFNLLRLCENDLLEYQQASGVLAPRDQVRSENNRVSAAIFHAVCRLVTNVRPQIANKSPEEQNRIWENETLACFTILKTANFTSFVPGTFEK